MKKIVLALIVCLWACRVEAAITLVQSTNCTGTGTCFSTGTTASCTLTSITAGNTLVMAMDWAMTSGTSTMSSVADGGADTFTIAAGTLADTTATHYSHVYVQFAYVLSAAGGTKTITATASTTVGTGFVTCYELTSGGSHGHDGPSTGNSAVPTSASVTTSTNGAYAIADGALDNGFGFGSGWFTAGSGWTMQHESGSGNLNQYTEHQAQSSAGAIQGTATSGFPGVTGPWAASIMTIEIAGGGAPARPCIIGGGLICDEQSSGDEVAAPVSTFPGRPHD